LGTAYNLALTDLIDNTVHEVAMARFPSLTQLFAYLKLSRSASIPAMKPFPLLQLPGELRQQIWDLVLFPGEGVKIDISGEVPKTMNNVLAITQVCRQTHAECGHLQSFWEENDFVIFTHHLKDSTKFDSAYSDDTAPVRNMLNKLEQLVLALSPGFAARGQNMEVHLGAWNTRRDESRSLMNSEQGVFADIASFFEISADVLQVPPMISLDLVWGQGRNRFEFGTVILPIGDVEQVKVNARAAIRRKNRELGFSLAGGVDMRGCTVALETLVHRITNRGLPTPRPRQSMPLRLSLPGVQQVSLARPMV